MWMMSASKRCRCDECALSDFHDTHYHYDSPVSLAQQLAHLWPRPCTWQRCTWQTLDISPPPSSRRDELDVFGNPITRLAFERPHDELLVNAGLTVEVLARPALDLGQSPAWDRTRDSFTYSSQALSMEVIEACRYRFESPYVHLKKPSSSSLKAASRLASRCWSACRR